jgi:hypothetical protein
MRNLIFAACFLIASGHLALAQYSRPSQSAQPAAEAQNLLSQYSARFRNSGQEGRLLLDAIHAAGLAKTAENVQAVRSLLASDVTAEERVGLARIPGSLYTYDNKTGLNAPPNDQLGLVSEIKSGKNRYAAEILASQLGDAQILATSFPETQRALKQYLEENEPDMPQALGEYGSPTQ